MNIHVRRLKDCAVQACDSPRERKALFSDFGLEALLERAEAESMSAKAILVAMICECCCTDGRLNNCKAAIKTVQRFVKESFGEPPDYAYGDLARILHEGPRHETISRWVDSTFD